VCTRVCQVGGLCRALPLGEHDQGPTGELPEGGSGKELKWKCDELLAFGPIGERGGVSGGDGSGGRAGAVAKTSEPGHYDKSATPEMEPTGRKTTLLQFGVVSALSPGDDGPC